MPQDITEENEASEVTFVLQGFSTLSHKQLTGGGSTSSPNKLLDRDLKKYESKANDYCMKIMKEAAVGVPAGTTPVLDPPDPLYYWNIQVCHLLNRVIFVNLYDLFFRLTPGNSTPHSHKLAKTSCVWFVPQSRVRDFLVSLGC